MPFSDLTVCSDEHVLDRLMLVGCSNVAIGSSILLFDSYYEYIYSLFLIKISGVSYRGPKILFSFYH